MSHVLRVSEVFDSIQGEGPSTGSACTFLRLAGCNLGCTFCDTKYTWDWNNYDPRQEIRRTALTELALRLRQSARLVVTGGEPMLQQADLSELFKMLPDDLPIELETNGTIEPLDALCQRVQQWNISPKLSNSCEPAHRRVRYPVLSRFRALETSWLKFVVRSEADLQEVNVIVTELSWPSQRVILMPLCETRAELEQASPGVVALSRASGYRFSTRLHLSLWDGRRGV